MIVQYDHLIHTIHLVHPGPPALRFINIINSGLVQRITVAIKKIFGVLYNSNGSLGNMICKVGEVGEEQHK